MKEKVFNGIIVIISIFVLIELIVKKSIIYAAIMDALNMWVNNLIPALFPFFIISDILINYNITDYIPKIIKIFCKKIFRINEEMLTILLLSVISGFPSNARNTRMLYDKGAITIAEANHILIFSHFANPVFILTTVAVFFLHNEKMGIILLITHYLSNFILGVCFRGNISCSNMKKSKNDISKNGGTIFVEAIRRASDTIITICGIVIVFLMLSQIVISTFKITGYAAAIVKGIFEITIGIEALSNLLVKDIYKVVIASMFLAFGGISVHIQVFSQIAGTDIKYLYFFMGRMYQMIIAGILTYIVGIICGI